MNQKEFPEAIEMEKQLLSAMFMKEGLVVSDVAVIIDANDLYRLEHRLSSKLSCAFTLRDFRLIISPLWKNFANPVTPARLTISTWFIL